MAEVSTNQHSREELVEFLAAYVRHAEESAAMVTDVLEGWRKVLGLRKPPVFPRLFLFELAAVLRIAHWQRSSALAELATEFPPSRQLLIELLDRFCADPLQYSAELKPERIPLTARVVQIWHQRCSWYGMQELGVDVMLQRPDPTELVRLLAEFAWEHRNLLDATESS